MVMNILSWESEWQHARKLADSLRQSEKNGSIQRLCFMPGGRACFRSEEPAGKLLHSLSWLCGDKAISHEWLDGEDCGSSLWQDGKESRYVAPHETPDWYSISHEVHEKTEAWEACAAFHKKLDSCWESYLQELWKDPLDEINKKSSEIAAALLCYRGLSELWVQKTWISRLNDYDDPLAAVREALAMMLSSGPQEETAIAVNDAIATTGMEHSPPIGEKITQEQSM